MDANVEVCCFTATKNAGPGAEIYCVNKFPIAEKDAHLLKEIDHIHNGLFQNNGILILQNEFMQFPNGVINFTLLPELRKLFIKQQSLSNNFAEVKTGLTEMEIIQNSTNWNGKFPCFQKAKKGGFLYQMVENICHITALFKK